ncbi:hypothetical protein GQ457_02G005200 [Hibiscus cannabinus]
MTVGKDKASISQLSNSRCELPPTTSISKTIELYVILKQWPSRLQSLFWQMAAKVALSSSLTTQIPLLPKPSSSASAFPCALTSHNTRLHQFKIHANLREGEGEGEGELKPKGKKKFITKEEEPAQYWQTAGEREGENPMKTPLPYIIIFGMSTPFVILAIAFANGWIKVPVR